MGKKKRQGKNRDLLEALLIKKSEEEEFFKRTGKQFSFFSKQKQISTNILIENPKTQNKKPQIFPI